MLHADYNDSYTLPSPGDKSGMFSVFITVLGFLDSFERGECKGVVIDFKEQGLYYDPLKGPNWWSYYFEPVTFGNVDPTDLKVVTHKMIRKFNRKVVREFSRQEGQALIQKYIHLKSELKQKRDAFVERHFKDHFVIGVHFRGTDKEREAPRVPPKMVIEEIQRAVSQLKTDRFKIFVATDEQPFLDEVQRLFKDRLIFIPAYRSLDEYPVHFSNKNQYKMGEEAILDCLLLSECNMLIRTASNLSFCSSFFNPAINEINLSQTGSK
jgi:hypothetical protein